MNHAQKIRYVDKLIRLEDLLRQVKLIRQDGGGNPRVHPNGFIQLDLDPVIGSWHDTHQEGHSGAAHRLHIWNPYGIELPHQETVNEIHDHVFDMHSEVVRGYLWQILYKFNTKPGQFYPTHERYRAVYRKSSDSRLEATGEIGVLDMERRFRVAAGSYYEQPAFTLHDSEPAPGTPTVTVMTKQAIHPGEASVICPLDVPPDNDFDRTTAADPEDLWRAIIMSLTLR